ncbi:MAG: serine hydrolase [Candidatus Aminicenantes bacterium]|nr:serine hydrolase [Candidatus Aminicenantes bacterium]
MRRKPVLVNFLLWVLVLFLLVEGSPAAQYLDIDRLVTQFNPEVRRMMLEGRVPSMTIALVFGTRIAWIGSFGYSNLWAQTPAVPSTVYLIGSTFKTMSMFALLQQMEQGKFKLDDRVNDYLAEFKIEGENPSQPVSFRHLLTHTSGLPADFGPHSVWGSSVPLPLKVYLPRILKLRNPPLTKVVYSNPAYTLIAYLIEKFSGVPYKKYIQENIFDPTEMKDTAFAPRPDMEERMAIPYLIDLKTGRHKPAVRLKANVWPAGIVYGTVIDQANWLIANLNRGVFKEHRFIREDTFQEIMTRQYDQFAGPISDGWLNETTGYGLTWWISQRKGDTFFAHSGSVSGYTAFLAGNLNERTGFAALTNGHRLHKHLFRLAVVALDLLEACREDQD